MNFVLICDILNTSINYRRILAVNYVKQTVLYHRIFIFALINIWNFPEWYLHETFCGSSLMPVQ